MTERQFQDAVLDLARLYRWLVYHPFDSRRSEPGYPDITLARSGRLILAELKTDDGRLTREQLRWGAVLTSVDLDNPGVTYAVWRPSDLQRIADTLR